MTVAAVVLAAGGGTRFTGASHKLLADLKGRAVVAHAVDAALASDHDEVIVVTGAIDVRPVLPAGLTFVVNDRWQDGIATSLAAAADAAGARGHAAITVGLGDQPFIPAEAWRLVGRADASPIVVATYGGKRRNPVRLAREVWGLLDTSGDEGARSLMRRRPELVREVACPGTPADVDTVEDLAQWS